ncbi:MAG TPA: hypothetical protein VKA46_24255 [Gemmataceae bacterium]|nr:hypothetical protein [Gemmataceae bacterium]
MTVTRFSLPLAAILLLSVSARAEPPANDWTRLEQGDISGQRWDVPLGYAPGLNRFIVLGGRLTDAEGDARPNWTVYGTFSLGTKYDRAKACAAGVDEVHRAVRAWFRVGWFGLAGGAGRCRPSSGGGRWCVTGHGSEWPFFG